MDQRPSQNLYEAAANGDVKTVLTLLTNGAQVNAQDINGDTALDLASYNNKIEVAKVLLQHKANPTSALFQSLMRRNGEMTQLLLKHQTDVNIFSLNDDPPLCIAILYNNNFDTIQSLLQAGARVNTMDSEGDTALFIAEMKHQTDVAKLLKKYGGISIMWQDYDINDHPLHYAILHNDFGNVQNHLKQGNRATINSVDSYQITPLHLAAINGNIRIAQFLLAHGANANAEDINGNSPLHVALGNKNSELAQLLVIYGADHNQKNDLNKTPLQLPCHSFQEVMAKEFLQEALTKNLPIDDTIRTAFTQVLQVHYDETDPAISQTPATVVQQDGFPEALTEAQNPSHQQERPHHLRHNPRRSRALSPENRKVKPRL